MSGRFAKLIHWLRVAGIACFIAASLALVVFWVRSYRVAERLHGRITDKNLFILASKQGRVTFIRFPPAFHPNFWKWEIRSYPVDNELSFPDNSVRRLEARWGFGLLRDPTYSLNKLFGPPRVSASSQNPVRYNFMEDGNVQFTNLYANFVVLRGTGVIVPYWFLVTLSTTIAIVLWIKRPWRYSLRSFFVVISLVAILLGLVSALDNGQSAVK